MRLSPFSSHLVGIAGAGMRALADVLRGWGWQLSGSDPTLNSARNSASAEDLARSGVRLWAHHAAENVSADCRWVVHSSAIPADNCELRRAAELAIPIRSYFQALGELAADMQTVAVAGTHGKSTTTAMTAHVLTEAGADPTVVCGAAPLGRFSGGRAGRSDLMLVEACEYRANFLHLRPRHAAILGIEPDHFDCYRSLEELESAFAQFAQSIDADGSLLVRYDCATARRVAAAASCRVETFGIDPRADWSAGDLAEEGGRYTWNLVHGGRPLCRVGLQVPGRHNLLNALAAAALAWRHDIAPSEIARSLGSFAGLHRRLEMLGNWRGVLMVDDYAHHPTEVAAALETVRKMAPGRRLWCVFQPHQASRTERLLDELAASLHNADKVLIAEIFRAREGPYRSGEVTAADLARQVRNGGGDVPPVHDREEITRLLATHLVPGDVLMTVGAGDIDEVGRELRRPTVRHEAVSA